MQQPLVAGRVDARDHRDKWREGLAVREQEGGDLWIGDRPFIIREICGCEIGEINIASELVLSCDKKEVEGRIGRTV